MKQLVEFLINNKSIGIIKKLNNDFVDLGLESGTLWAKCNLGADKPEDAGYYYQWSNLKQFDENSKDYADLWKFKIDKDYEINSTLKPKDDPATQLLGKKVHVPSRTQFKELINNTDISHITINDINGVLFTSRKNDNSIFLPLCGAITPSLGLKNKNVNATYMGNLLNIRRPRHFLGLWLDNSYEELTAWCIIENANQLRPVKDK